MDMSAFTQDKTPVDRNLEAWLRDRVPEADDVRVEGLDRVDFGHSAEMMVLTLVERRGDDETRRGWSSASGRSRPRYSNPRPAKAIRDFASVGRNRVRVPPVLWLGTPATSWAGPSW